MARSSAHDKGFRRKVPSELRKHLQFGVGAGTIGAVPRDASSMLDDVNKAIITQLQSDGRRSYAAIATAVGLSEAAVRQRAQRLLAAGAMRLAAVAAPRQGGSPRQAMIGVNAEGDLRDVADKLSAL